LATVPDFRELLSAEYWRLHAIEAAYAGVGVAAFAFFLIATFPYGAALRAMLAPMGFACTAGGQSFSFPLGARLDGVRVIDTSAPHAPPILDGQSVRIAPALASMLLLRPGVRASADVFGGSLSILARRSGEATALKFQASALNLASVTALRELGAAFGGQFFGSGDLVIQPGSIAADSGAADLHTNQFEFRIANGIVPPVRLGQVAMRLKLARGRLELENIRSAGGDLTVAGHGSIQLAPDWRDSRLKLSVKIIPAPTARTRLEFLLKLLPHPPGPQPYTIGGTIASPVIS
jgi:type II secretion system protein N